MTPDKRVEEIVEQYAQSVQDMYFLAGARVSVETWKNTKDFLRNALTQHHQDLMREVVAEARNKTVDYICSHSEEAVEGLFYVTNDTLEEARIEAQTIIKSASKDQLTK